MKTNYLTETLFANIKEKLIQAGIPNIIIEKTDTLLFILAILFIAFIAGKLTHFISIKIAHHIQHHNSHISLVKLIENNTFKKLSSTIPPLIVISLLPIVFSGKPQLLNTIENITWIYFTITIASSLSAILSTISNIAYNNKKYHDRPIKGFIQITQIIIYIISTIIIISILTNKSPFYLIGGLGAFAAVLMLVFKDTIMGFVSGILLLENDMIHLGDWIEVPNSTVNGTVIDMSLTIVKIKNFDNTIITIPPYTLISGSFINWRAMNESGGRRIMRSYTIKIDNIKECTTVFLEKIKKCNPEMQRFINAMQNSEQRNNITNEEKKYGTIDTNLGLFRAYATFYLKNHPALHKKMLIMVRTLSPTQYGLPLQIYCFTNDTEWSHYESIQSEIMEHLAVMLPIFELLPYQSSSSHDNLINGLIERGFSLENTSGIPIGILKK